MSLLDIDFAFDFPVTPDNRGARHQMTVDLANPPANPRLLHDMLLDLDLSKAEDLATGLFEMSEWIQYDLIIPRLKFSSHKLTKHELLFDVAVTISGKTFTGRDHLELSDTDYSSLRGAEADEFDEWIISSYEASDRNFDVTDVKGIYHP